MCAVAEGCPGGRDPKICPDDSGGAYVAWQRNPVNENIFMKRVLADGTLAPGWPAEGAVVCTTNADTYLQSLASDGLGGAFAAWIDYRGGPYNSVDLYATRILWNGQRAPGFVEDGNPICRAPGWQRHCHIIPDGQGGAYFLWNDERRGEYQNQPFALRLTATGERAPGWPEDGLALSTGEWPAWDPVGVSLGSEGLLVVWGDIRPGAAGVYAQKLTPDGAIAPGWPQDGRRVVTTDSNAGIWDLRMDGSGALYLGLSFYYPALDEVDAHAQRILLDGSIAPGWPEAGVPVCTLPWEQWIRSVIADTSGATFVWMDSRSTTHIYALRLLPDGTRATGWVENGNLISDLPGFQGYPEAVGDAAGGVFVAFEYDDVCCTRGYVQRITKEGTPATGWPSSGIGVCDLPMKDETDVTITTDGRGGSIVTWQDEGYEHFLQIYAQRFDGDGPTPTTLSLVRADAAPDRVSLLWHRAEGEVPEATIYRRTPSDEWFSLGTSRFDGGGRLAFDDRAVEPGARYAYRLGYVEHGVHSFSTEAWVDVPRAFTFALEGAIPNPATDALAVAFSLPAASPATLDLLDLAGRRVESREVGTLGAGRHLLRLDPAPRPAPGVYWLRLVRGDNILKSKVVITR